MIFHSASLLMALSFCTSGASGLSFVGGILPTTASISDAGEAGKSDERKDFLDFGEGEGRSMWTAEAKGTRVERWVER